MARSRLPNGSFLNVSTCTTPWLYDDSFGSPGSTWIHTGEHFPAPHINSGSPIDSYRKGLDTAEIAFAMHTYKSHRKVGSPAEIKKLMAEKLKQHPQTVHTASLWVWFWVIYFFCNLILQKFFQYIILYISNTSFLATLDGPKVCAHAVADGRFEFLRCLPPCRSPLWSCPQALLLHLQTTPWEIPALLISSHLQLIKRLKKQVRNLVGQLTILENKRDDLQASTNAQKVQPQGRRNASIRRMEEAITLTSQALANVWQTLEYGAVRLVTTNFVQDF